LERSESYQVVASCADGEDVLEAIIRLKPDLVVSDLRMPKLSGLGLLKAVRSRGDQTPFILLAADVDDEDLMEALRLEVNGIVLKEGVQTLLIRCLDEVQKGRRWIDSALLNRAVDLAMSSDKRDGGLHGLSDREREVANLVAEGKRNKDIAQALGTTEGTIKSYLYRIYDRLGVASRTELAVLVKSSVR
jgi:two-component system nitrate/nitrite response regulator NarP